MNAIGRNNNVGVDLGAVDKPHPGLVIALLELNTLMTTMDHTVGKRRCQEINEVSTVHAICRVPAGGVCHLYRRDGRAVISHILRPVANECAPFLHRWSEANTLEMTHTVRCDVETGANLSQFRRLLIDGHLKSLRDHGIGSE